MEGVVAYFWLGLSISWLGDSEVVSIIEELLQEWVEA